MAPGFVQWSVCGKERGRNVCSYQFTYRKAAIADLDALKWKELFVHDRCNDRWRDLFKITSYLFLCVPGIKGHFKAASASRKGATNNLPEALTQVCRLHVTLSQIVVKVKHEQK